MLEGRSLIAPDKLFYTFHPPPLSLFRFVVNTWLSQAWHTQHRRLFPFCCSVSQIPESFLRLGFWQTTEIMVSLCRDANAAARQSQQRPSQRFVNHRCCGRSRGFLVDFEGQLTPSSFVLHLRYLALSSYLWTPKGDTAGSRESLIKWAISHIRTGLTLHREVGNEILTVLHSNFTHSARRHFNHLHIIEYGQ